MTTFLLYRSLTLLVVYSFISNIYGVLSPDIPVTYNHSSTRIKREDTKSNEKGANGTCIAPPQPANGRWIVLGSNLTNVPGQIIDKFTVLSVTCNNNYVLSTHETFHLMVCLDEGKWNSEMPHCNKPCPPVSSTSSISVSCKDGTGNIIPCDSASDNTVLSYRCSLYYESDTLRSSILCIDGSWTNTIPTCTPVCGQRRVEAQPLIIDGKRVARGNNPWTAAIYNNKELNTYTYICGGTLLSPSIVLTAAHCVSSIKNGKAFNTRYYQVAMGKYYNKYKDRRDEVTVQYSKVSHIEIQPDYRGEIQNLRSDIAILKVQSPFAISHLVQPVCFTGSDNFNLGPSSGVITGWSEPSDVVKELEVSYYNAKDCNVHFNNDFFEKYFTNDKICGKHNIEQGIALCAGISGAGMVYKHPETGRFFIYGVVTISDIEREGPGKLCSKNNSFLGTSVAYHNEWISKTIYLLSRNDNQ